MWLRHRSIITIWRNRKINTDKGGRDSVRVTGPQEEGDGEKLWRSLM